MARKSRYFMYMQGMNGVVKKEKNLTKKSLLGKLKELKNQEFHVQVPLGGADGKRTSE